MRGHVEKLLQHETKPSAVFVSRHPPSAVFFIHTSIGSALHVILYFLVVWLGLVPKLLRFSVIRISVSVYTMYERTNRISEASFSDLQCHSRDQSCCLSGVMLNNTINKCLYNLHVFLAVKRTVGIVWLRFTVLHM